MLHAFFKEFQVLRAEPAAAKALPPPDLSRVTEFFGEFQAVFNELQRQGELIDIWEVAGLKRDELRHVSVLAWFLNSNAPHGFGNEIFQAWTSTLRLPETQAFPNPMPWADRYRVATEVYPLDGTNRFDIEISSEHFYICVEVKINAGEGDNQLYRYRDVAEKRAGRHRPFCVVYLSPQPPKKSCAKVIFATWPSFASAVRVGMKDSLPNASFLSRRMLEQFLTRVERL